MSIRRTVTGLAEVGLGFVVGLPVHDILANAGHEGSAFIASLGGFALGIDGVLRTGEGIVGLPEKEAPLSAEELRNTDYYNRRYWG